MYLMADLGPIPEDTGADIQASRGAEAGGDALAEPVYVSLLLPVSMIPDYGSTESRMVQNVACSYEDPSARYKVLCRISIDARGTIAMRPDFTKGSGFYKLQSPFSAQGALTS